jgi:peptidoglycan/xylan/chitin deacetylase (PgdA/CDA1 family)
VERFFHSLSEFREQIRFLARFRVLSLAELATLVAAQKSVRGPAAVITLDDGYANNLQAGEILSKYRLPWALFIPTGTVGSAKTAWADELSLLVLHGRAEAVEMPGRHWALRSTQERAAAFEDIRYLLVRLPRPKRLEAMATLRTQYPKGETERLLAEFPCLKMMSWGEVSQFAADGVEIGSHGVDHEIHHTDQPPAVRQCELIQSKAELEHRLGKQCRFFAFPHGETMPSSPEEVKAAGYDLAFTTKRRSVVVGANPYLLPRLTARRLLRSFAREFLWPQ